MNKSLVFTPGCDWKIDRRRILFVEYETVTGKPESKRFDLSTETEYVVDGYKTLSFDEISKPESKSQYSIRRIVYFEKECNSMVAFARGCKQNRLFIPTRIEFDTVISTKRNDKVEKTYNKLVLPNTNSAYGIASRDWGDVLAESARYIHMQQSRCSGKTLWLSSATSFADKQPLWNISHYHDICEQWLKEPPTPYEFISDDLEDCEKGVPNTKLYVQNTETGEVTPFNGVKSFSPIVSMTYKGVVYTNPTSENGREGVMSRTPLYERRDYFQAEIGDVVLYSGKCFVWRGRVEGWKEIDPNGYFDTDMASSLQEKLMKAIENSKYGISFPDGDTVKKIKMFEEEIKMAEKTRFDMYKPKISKVIFNEPASIVFWTDGTKTIVKCGENDIFDPEKGVAMACMKKLLGTNKTGSNYLDKVQEYFDKYDEDYTEECKTIGEILSSIFESTKKSTDIPPEKHEPKGVVDGLPYPLTITLDRYNGVYSGGLYVAWNCDADAVPTEPSDDDVTCADFWNRAEQNMLDGDIPCYGIGVNPEKAILNLVEAMLAKEMAEEETE